MKKVCMLLLVLWIGGGVYGQGVLSVFWEKYSEHPDFTVVNITPKMFKLMAAVLPVEEDPEEYKELKEMVTSLQRLHVFTTEKNGDGHFKETLKLLQQPKHGYEELMTVREGERRVSIYTRENKDVVEELVLFVHEKNQFTMINISGKIDLKKIARLSGMVDVKELEHLDKVEKKEKKEK